MDQEVNEECRCLECGDVIGYGRSDRKFCSLSCKNRYNNRKLRKVRVFKTQVLQALDHNYSLLRSCIRREVREVPLPEMEEQGFDRQHFTGCCQHGRRKEFRCFDIRYSIVGNMVRDISRGDVQ